MRQGSERRRLAGLVAALVACSDAPSSLSSETATRDMRVTMTVNGTTSGTKISGTLTGIGAALRLVEGDRLVLVTRTAEATVALDASKYAVEIGPYGGPLAIRLLRPEGRGGTLEIGTMLAEPFHVVSAPSVSLSAPITVGWTGAAEPSTTTSLAFSGPCVVPVARALTTDTGTYTWNRGEIVASRTPPPCTAKLTVMRTNGTATQTAAGELEVRP